MKKAGMPYLGLAVVVSLSGTVHVQAPDAPATVDGLDCKALDFSLTNADILTPGKIDTAQLLKMFTPELGSGPINGIPKAAKG